MKNKGKARIRWYKKLLPQLEAEFDFIVGVPDSTLKELLNKLDDSKLTHVRANEEGEAIGIAVGYHLATGKTPVVYMQSDGLLNALNPLLSLARIYDIPIFMIIGHRGEGKDAIQHVPFGQVFLKSLELFGIDEIPDKSYFNGQKALVIKKGQV